ncbi:hypothetical protein [Chroococcidiopsis sp. CCMEE 29]|nr:hypothetical protein [Chroococcidiopsis sp. CCMEE 29]
MSINPFPPKDLSIVEAAGGVGEAGGAGEAGGVEREKVIGNFVAVKE